MVPILGLGVIAEGVIRFGVMLFNKQVRKGEWQVAVASTFRNHIVVCWLGRVGYRVVKQFMARVNKYALKGLTWDGETICASGMMCERVSVFRSLPIWFSYGYSCPKE